jgi:hypothetical protein
MAIGAVLNPPLFSTKSTFLIPRGNNQKTDRVHFVFCATPFT